MKTVSTLMWTGGLTGIYGAMGDDDKLLREVVLINIMTKPSVCENHLSRSSLYARSSA